MLDPVEVSRLDCHSGGGRSRNCHSKGPMQSDASVRMLKLQRDGLSREVKEAEQDWQQANQALGELLARHDAAKATLWHAYGGRSVLEGSSNDPKVLALEGQVQVLRQQIEQASVRVDRFWRRLCASRALPTWRGCQVS